MVKRLRAPSRMRQHTRSAGRRKAGGGICFCLLLGLWPEPVGFALFGHWSKLFDDHWSTYFDHFSTLVRLGRFALPGVALIDATVPPCVRGFPLAEYHLVSASLLGSFNPEAFPLLRARGGDGERGYLGGLGSTLGKRRSPFRPLRALKRTASPVWSGPSRARSSSSP